MSQVCLSYRSSIKKGKDAVFVHKDKILRAVGEHFGITPDGMAVKSRKRHIAYPRQVAMFFLAKYTTLTMESIGLIFLSRDHTTVSCAKQTIQDLIDVSGVVRSEVYEIEKKILE